VSDPADLQRQLQAKSFDVDLVIVARNHARTIAQVLREIPPRTVRSVLVVDNGSTDATVRVAEDAGAVVIREGRVGHGMACLRAVAHLSTLPVPPEVVVFMSADGTNDPADLPALLRPVRDALFDLVIGSRALGDGRVGASARMGSFVAVNLIHAIYGHRYSDMGPLRAIRYPALIALGLRDTGNGWMAEMMVRAVRVGLRIAEVPVRSRPALPGTPRGFGGGIKQRIDAGGRTLYAILRHATAR
jgi:glycosyltransferase involved in cell wall biosynthesis